MKLSKGKRSVVLSLLLTAVLASSVSVEAASPKSNTKRKNSGIAQVLASVVTTPVGEDEAKKEESNKKANTKAKKSVRYAEIVLTTPKPDIEQLLENARIKLWETKAIVTVSENEFVYMRQTPEEGGSVVAIMPHGAAGDVLEKGELWSKIKSGTMEGYVSNQYLEFGEKALSIAENLCGYVARVSSYEANIRETPSLDAKIIASASEGKYFEVLGETHNWVTVKCSQDQIGYMSHDVLDVFLATGTAVRLDEENEKKKAEEEAKKKATEEENQKSKQQKVQKSTEAENSSSSSSDNYVEAAASPVENNNHLNSSVFKVTAYCACELCCGNSNGITASGTKVSSGRTIAVDTSVIPLGSTVYIDGVPYIAEDTGVSGYTIDIYMDSHVEALNWGVRYCTINW